MSGCSTPIVCCLFSRSVMPDSLQPHGLQHTRLSCPSPSPRVCSNSCPLSWWCYLTISSSASPFSFVCKSSPHQSSCSLLYLILKPWFWHPRPPIPQPHSIQSQNLSSPQHTWNCLPSKAFAHTVYLETLICEPVFRILLSLLLIPSAAHSNMSLH